ncbi:MAG: carbohydrate kinase [Chloroflexi bacterium]|nr:MAG: carbohydrate kinase [Chloroflexota bacterium]
MDNSFDVLMVGHFAKDELIVDGKGEISSGGGVYYGSIALRQLGLKVAVATRLHADDFPRLGELCRAGVEVFATPAQQTSGIANYYQSHDMERRVCKLMGFAGTMSIDEIPELPVKVIMVSGIIAGEVDLPTLKLLAQRAPLALDVQGFVRVPEGDDLVFKPWPDMVEGLQQVTYLKVDRAEAEHLTGETDLYAACQKLASYGPKEIILTQNSGPLVYADGNFFHAPFKPRSLAGRTGRGDTCFSSYIGRRLSAGPEESTRWAAAVTSLKQEKPGPWYGPLEEAEALMHQL